ncbi:hypothetical protein [Lutimonas vermicola]|uniref:Uncharacterized protein n=1 Tax=Lutimonas vermicola TaxID=414288 RepID=A0ABU9L2N6_9FLAO
MSETDLAWQKKFVTITYKGLIDNFSIRILWIPREEAPLGHISGPGIMEFTDLARSTRFTIKSMDLAISMDRIGIDSEEQRQSPLDKSFELQFDWTSNKDGLNGNITEPFFFYDVDFDGKVELVVTQYSYGVQNSNTYKAYKLNESTLENDSKQITNEEPFSLLNDFTEFNKVNKSISIGSFFGGGNTQTSIYKKVNPSEFKLISIVKYTFEDKITFELVDGEMVEVKRENMDK